MRDHVYEDNVAVKVVRAIEKYAREAQIEASILEEVQKSMPPRFPIAR